MTLNRNGLLTKIAYPLSSNKELPQKTNLCNFFWRFLVCIFFVWPIGIPILLLIYYMIYAVSAFIFGYKPCIESPRGDSFAPISWWPKIHGHNISPLGILVLAAIFFKTYEHSGEAYAAIGGRVGLLWIAGAITCIAVVTAVTYQVATRAFFGETWKIAKEYVRAKKGKYCPEIVFVDPNEKSETKT